jgi:acyl carrier protein
MEIHGQSFWSVSMNTATRTQVRDFIQQALASHADADGFSDEDPLFSSGRLDSFTMMKLVMHLEQTYGIDFSDTGFDVDLVDSVDAIVALVDAGAGR